ncbi:hypothetical protein AMJ39_09095 [candidate division TA06 bacterium DG_24]|uniref:Glycosyltransferase subfamily 4-like N-terminal domain-containing protein n=1 Tax=candidate division TA06 bacterium DG_24 TaxID=1703770 RepID=A0A0S7WNW7_UNCT6|nr:MAG: hypothetical protein AMJ39_09095 [candidate division TA06 bacterium DG_24]
MKRLLLISYAFPPMAAVGGHRTVKFAKFLPEFGWEPTVLTVRSGFNYAYDPSLLDDLPGSLKVLRTPSMEPLRWWEGRKGRETEYASGEEVDRWGSSLPTGSETECSCSAVGGPARDMGRAARGIKQLARDLLTTPDEQVWWIPFAVAAGLKAVADGIDVIYTTSPPHSTHLAGWLLSLLTGKPWVADFRDLWTSNIHFLPSRRGGKRERVERWLEARLLRDAAAIITTSEKSRELLSSQIGGNGRADREARTRWFTITNGFDPDDFADAVEEGGRGVQPGSLSPRDWGLLRERDGGRFIITFLGSLYGDRRPDLLLAGLREWFRTEPEVRPFVRVKLVGNKSPDIEGRLSLGELVGSIDISGHLPHRKALALLRRSNLLLLLLGGGEENGGVIPAKLFEYLYVGQPILALVPEGEAAMLVRLLARGSVVTEESPQVVARELRYWYRAWRGEIDPPPTDGGGLLSLYERRNCTSMLARVLEYVRKDNR